MRAWVTLLALALVSSSYAVTIKHTQAHFMPQADNVRLGEFFGIGKKSTPIRSTLYSDSASRAGLFFTADLDTKLKNIPAGTVAQVEVIFEGDRAARVFKFDLAPVATSDHKILYLGLTAPEYRDKKTAPHLLAWKVSLLDAEGKTLSESHSKVWQY